MDIVSPTPIIEFIVIGAGVLGSIFLLFLLILAFLSRGGQTISRRTGGALALTVALIILVSGLWCVYLSPTITYTEYKDSLYREISVEGQSSWSYAVDVLKGDTMDGSVSLYVVIYDRSPVVDKNFTDQTFSLFIYDPDGEIVWSQINVTYSYFTVKALKTGVHEIEVYNPNVEPIRGYVSFNIQGKVTVRPLEPLGQLMSLISLPIIGFGFWASGIYAVLRKRE